MVDREAVCEHCCSSIATLRQKNCKYKDQPFLLFLTSLVSVAVVLFNLCSLFKTIPHVPWFDAAM